MRFYCSPLAITQDYYRSFSDTGLGGGISGGAGTGGASSGPIIINTPAVQSAPSVSISGNFGGDDDESGTFAISTSTSGGAAVAASPIVIAGGSGGNFNNNNNNGGFRIIREHGTSFGGVGGGHRSSHYGQMGGSHYGQMGGHFGQMGGHFGGKGGHFGGHKGGHFRPILYCKY